ncbi:hypothetical protein GGR55DRAFT_676926 [Xylaria sp. FL0064]|nr:hypothetical protein GGR55DRAFT_676926 [Xylaria sp. FL0064]
MRASEQRTTETDTETETEMETEIVITLTAFSPPNETSDSSTIATNTDDTVPSPTPTTPSMLVTATSEIGPPVQQLSSQTVTHALTAIFTPPPSCAGRYYVLRTADDFYTEWGIFSDTSDRLYRSCQPDPEAYDNYYSPGACPSNMNIAAVSSTPEDPASSLTNLWLVDSGFVWDFHSCYSIVSTKTTVLIAPNVSTQDIFIPVSQVPAWHPPIMAVWQTSDLPLFPSDVMRQKSSIAQYGWAAAYSTNIATPTPFESTTPSSKQNESTERPLSLGAIIGIVIASLALVFLPLALICVYRRRRRQRQNKPCEQDAALTGSRRSELGGAWRAQMISPTTSQITELQDRQRSNTQCEKQAPIELDGGSVTSPLDDPQSRRCESTISPISDMAVSPTLAP